MEAVLTSDSQSAAVAAWRFYERMDRVRTRQGEWLGAFGWGPQESPSRTVLGRSGFGLKAYAAPGAEGPVVLLVPAPIKRAYIWDLAPGSSVVGACCRRGLRPYLVHWEAPPADAGLADYGDRCLAECLDAIQAETGNARVMLLGHSLGGILAAICAALYPERIGALVLINAPVHFSPSQQDGALGPVLQTPGAQRLLASLPARVPGSLFSLAGFMAAPGAFGKDRWADWWRSLPDADATRTHMQVERWTLDELPLARQLVRDVVHRLYGADAFMAGTLRCGSRRAVASRVAAPLLAVAEQGCGIVPPSTVLPLFEAAASPEKRLLWYEGDVGVAIQHVGALVGRNAHARLWPVILDWIWKVWEGKLGSVR